MFHTTLHQLLANLAAVIVVGTCSVYAQSADVAKQPKLHTYVYKTVDELAIKADVYQYDDTEAKSACSTSSCKTDTRGSMEAGQRSPPF